MEEQKVYLTLLKWKRSFHLYATWLVADIPYSLQIGWHWPHSSMWIAGRSFLFLNWFLSFPYVPRKWRSIDQFVVVVFCTARTQLACALHFPSTLTSISSGYNAVIDFPRYLYSSRAILGNSFLMGRFLQMWQEKSHLCDSVTFSHLIYHIKKMCWFSFESKTCFFFYCYSHKLFILIDDFFMYVL